MHIKPAAVATGIALAFLGAFATQQVRSEDLSDSVTLEIDAQPIETALLEFSKQTGLQLVIPTGSLPVHTAPKVSGNMSLRIALNLLLSDTDLTYKIVGNRTLTIVPPKGRASSGNLSLDRTNGSRFLLTQANQEDTVGSSAVEDSPSRSGENQQEAVWLEEILVTAQKRKERLQDVPIPVSVLTTDSLLKSGRVNLRDYYSQVPGLNLGSSVGGTPAIAIRGITTGSFINPTVGIVIDDVPYGASTALGGGTQVLDFDPNDLAQIEVLRGPQGTLYGASSLGGLLKYVTVDPSLDEMSARLSGSTQSTRNGDGLSYVVRGSVNLPIGDTVAFRASAFTREDAGFIDDASHDARGINDGDAYGGRLAMLWRPSDDISVKLSALRQKLKTHAGDTVNLVSSPSGPSADALENSAFVPGRLGADRELTFLTGIVNASIGKADLTAVSGYARSEAAMWDPSLGWSDAALFGTVDRPGDIAYLRALQPVSKFSQELRMSIPLGRHFDWLAGAFYTKESSTGGGDTLTAGNIQTGDVLGSIGNIYKQDNDPIQFRELAVFTNLTVHFTDRFDLQLGARQSHLRQRQVVTLTGTLVGGATIVSDLKSTDDAFTYLITPQFKLSPNVMVYSRIAQGYRPGSPGSRIGYGDWPTEADRTNNYEIGLKGDFIDNLLTVDASVYSIDWKDMQVLITPPAPEFQYRDNAGTARSRGVELSLQLRPIEGMVFSAWGAWSDATLESLAPTASLGGAQPGDRLPYSSRFSGHAAVDYEFPVSATLRGLVGTSITYVGDRLNDFSGSATVPRTKLAAYSQWDLHAGVTFTDWEINAFINNVTDKRGLSSIGVWDAGTGRIIRPRTVGLTVTKDF